MTAYKAVWLQYENPLDADYLQRIYSHRLYRDKDENPVFIPDSMFAYKNALEKCPKVRFLSAMEHNDKTLKLDVVA